MKFSPKILQQAVILGLFFTNSAMAHSLHLFADYDGNAISGKAYYSDQTPAAETYVEVIKTGETAPTVYGKTDASGHFSLPLNQTGTRPYFFLSFIRGSLVKKPAFFNTGRYSMSA